MQNMGIEIHVKEKRIILLDIFIYIAFKHSA